MPLIHGKEKESACQTCSASRGRKKEYGGIGVDVVELCEAGGPLGDYRYKSRSRMRCIVSCSWLRPVTTGSFCCDNSLISLTDLVLLHGIFDT